MDLSQYSQQEVARLQLGFILRKQAAEGGSVSGQTAAGGQKRKLRAGQEKQRQEMFEDLGIE